MQMRNRALCACRRDARIRRVYARATHTNRQRMKIFTAPGIRDDYWFSARSYTFSLLLGLSEPPKTALSPIRFLRRHIETYRRRYVVVAGKSVLRARIENDATDASSSRRVEMDLLRCDSRTVVRNNFRKI